MSCTVGSLAPTQRGFAQTCISTFSPTTRMISIFPPQPRLARTGAAVRIFSPVFSYLSGHPDPPRGAAAVFNSNELPTRHQGPNGKAGSQQFLGGSSRQQAAQNHARNAPRKNETK